MPKKVTSEESAEDRAERDFHVYDSIGHHLRYIVVIRWAYRMTDPPGQRMYAGIAMNDDGSEFEHCVIPELGCPGVRIPFRSLPASCVRVVMNDISESFS